MIIIKILKDVLMELREIRKELQAIKTDLEFVRKMNVNPQELSQAVYEPFMIAFENLHCHHGA